LIGGISRAGKRRRNLTSISRFLNQLKRPARILPNRTTSSSSSISQLNLRERGRQNVQVEVDDVKVKLGRDKKNWLCFATKRMAPNHDKLVALRKRFNEIAHKVTVNTTAGEQQW